MNTATTTDQDIARLYRAGTTPEWVDVPELTYLAINGRGDPNVSRRYRDAVQALYSVSYSLKFTLKRAHRADYRVAPLEGLWRIEDGHDWTEQDRSAWSWTALIRQPSVVTPDLVDEAVQQVVRLRELPAAADLRLESFTEGHAAQVLHVGPYSAEGPTIERLHGFIAEAGNEPAGDHHEIYLSDPRRTSPDRLRTIIRQPVS